MELQYNLKNSFSRLETTSVLYTFVVILGPLEFCVLKFVFTSVLVHFQPLRENLYLGDMVE